MVPANVQLALTGFNNDVIYANPPEISAATGTNTTMDGTLVLGGLPASTTFTSAANAAVQFTLQPYTASNVLQVTTGSPTGTLTLTTPTSNILSLNLLLNSGNGSTSGTVTLNFAGGSMTQTTGVAFNDWTVNDANSALTSLQRVLQSNSNVVDTLGTLQEVDIPLSAADQAKTLNSITFTQTTGGASATSDFFAVSANTGQAPAITSANAATFTTGTLGTFTVTATGSPAPTFTETGALPTGVSLSNAGVLSGTPAAGTSGSYPIMITAANGVLPNDTQNFTLTVSQPPAITSTNSTTFLVGAAGSFTVTATGFPAPTFTEVGALPSGVTLSNAGVLSGPPPAGTNGVYPITITAANGVLPNNTQSFTLTVNQAPAITSANSATFPVGATGSFTVTATGLPAPTFTEVGALPSGVTFSNAGVLSGTPAAGTSGTYSITITAANGVLPNGTQNFTLTVSQAPAITSANSTTFSVGAAGSFTVIATGFPSPTFTETGTLPAGVTFNTATGVLSGTPAAGAVGTYTLTITASNGVAPVATQTFTLIVKLPVAPGAFAVGAGSGSPEVKVYDATGKLGADFFAYDPAFLGGVHVAMFDVNGDGVLDVITGAGAGGGPHVKIIDGTKLNQVQANGQIANSALLASFFAYDPAFSGGVFVAAGHLVAGTTQIITGAGAGGGPHVKAIDFTKVNQVSANGQIADSAVRLSFQAYDINFAGGVSVAAGDYEGIGTDEIITAAGAGGGPHVKVIRADGSQAASFFAYEGTFSGGVFVAAGTLFGTTKASIVTGRGLGGTPEVKVFNVGTTTPVDDYFAYTQAFLGGVRVGVVSTAPGKDVLLTGAGPNGGPHVKLTDPMSLQDLNSFFAFSANVATGVYVGGN